MKIISLYCSSKLYLNLDLLAFTFPLVFGFNTLGSKATLKLKHICIIKVYATVMCLAPPQKKNKNFTDMHYPCVSGVTHLG